MVEYASDIVADLADNHVLHGWDNVPILDQTTGEFCVAEDACPLYKSLLAAEETE